MSDVMAPVPTEHPLRQAWDAYRQTDDYKNSKHWAMKISPIVSSGHPDADGIQSYEIMPRSQRETHIEGSLWAAFVAGYKAASGTASV